MLNNDMESISRYEMLKLDLKGESFPNLPKRKVRDELINNKVMLQALVKHKADKEQNFQVMPKLIFTTSFEDIVDYKRANCRMQFEELLDIKAVGKYVFGCNSLQANIEILQDYHKKKSQPEKGEEVA